MLGAGLLYFIFSFLTWGWTGLLSWPHSGWGSWYIIPTLIMVAILVLTAIRVFVPTVNLTSVKPEFIVYGGALASTLVIIACIVLLASSGYMFFAAWACLVTALATTYFAAIIAQKAGAKLPVKVPTIGGL